MDFYRLIKPDWSKPKLDNGQNNPKFVREISDPKNTYEGCNFDFDFLKSKNEEGYNIYFFPNHPSKDVYSEGVYSLSGKHIETFNYVFVDMDLKDKIYSSKEEFLQKLREFQLKPTMVVDSGHGIHAYWKISDLDRDLYVYIQVALINHFKTDESIYTVLQLMRCPGFKNTKQHDEYIDCSVLEEESSSREYQFSEFPGELMSNMSADDIAKAQKHLDRLDGKLTIHAPEYVDIDEIPEKFYDFLNDPKHRDCLNIWTNPKGPPFNDRSRNDMKLANELFKNNFNKKEALSIISNTEKARSHGNRKHYAELTIEKIYTEKLNSKFMTVGQRNRSVDPDKNLGDLVNGTSYFDTDVLGAPWRKRELLGLIAGTGVGKTTVTLKWMKDSIQNNPQNDDIYVFFTLEMSVGEIVTRWNNLVGIDSPLADRLYVIGNETEDGEPRNLGLQEILEDCRELKKLTGKNIGMTAVDHVGIISRHIDIRKPYTFGIDSESNAGFGNIKTLSLNSLCNQLKVLCKMLDTFIIVLTQTTKEKGVGDLPIDKDGAYGMSNYENIMDRIITIWQPLKLVQGQTKTRYLSWQYVKIRHKHVNDKINTNEAKLLTFDLITGDLRNTTAEEYEEFNRLLPKVHEIRDAQIKKKGGVGYSIHVDKEALSKMLHKLSIAPHQITNVNGVSNELAKIQSNQHS